MEIGPYYCRVFSSAQGGDLHLCNSVCMYSICVAVGLIESSWYEFQMLLKEKTRTHLKGALCSFDEKIKTWNVNIYIF